MSRSLAIMTVVLWGIPLVFAVIAVTTDFLPAMIFMIAMTVFIAGIYCWTWIRFRPSEFVLGDGAMEVIWPAKRRQVPYVGMHSAKIITRRELKDLVGFGMRVGAGGLWGAFGWLWTTKRGIVQMYISRLDRFIWIERDDRPWLITPERPDEFLAALSQRIGGSVPPR